MRSRSKSGVIPNTSIIWSSMPRCCAVTHTEVSIPAAFAARMTGAILIASGRVPKTARIRMSILSRSAEHGLRCAICEHLPVVLLDYAVPCRFPRNRACLHKRVRPSLGAGLRKQYVWPRELLPGQKGRRHNTLAAGAVFNHFDLKSKIRTRSLSLREYPDIDSVEILCNFRGRDISCCDHALTPMRFQQPTPNVGGSNNEQLCSGNTRPRGEKGVHRKVHARKGTVVTYVSNRKVAFDS